MAVAASPLAVMPRTRTRKRAPVPFWDCVINNRPVQIEKIRHWAGRTNGPIDNPISGCLSCHGTAQDPAAPGFINNACATDRQKMYWFRTFTGNQFFGAVDSTCTPTPVNPSTTHALDFSLQLSVSVQNVHQYNSSNPCPGFAPALGAAAPAASEQTEPPDPLRITR
jgi:hypothetical protein